MRRVLAFVLASVGVWLATPACGTEPVGVDACKKIERARCESAEACGISLERPLHEEDSPVNNVAACIRYYNDQCLHGLAVKDPGGPAVDACVQAIINGDCSAVRTPQAHPACSFLAPEGFDAGSDG